MLYLVESVISPWWTEESTTTAIGVYNSKEEARMAVMEVLAMMKEHWERRYTVFVSDKLVTHLGDEYYSMKIVHNDDGFSIYTFSIAGFKPNTLEKWYVETELLANEL